MRYSTQYLFPLTFKIYFQEKDYYNRNIRRINLDNDKEVSFESRKFDK